MRKLLSTLLVAILLFSCAGAETVKVGDQVQSSAGLHVSIDSAGLTGEWQGEASPTHSWIVVGITVTNYKKEAIFITEELSAILTYEGGYNFQAETIFNIDKFEPLVQLSGELVFKVPKMVAKTSPSDLEIELCVDSQSYQLELEYRVPSRTIGVMYDVYFDSPEEAIIYFAKCIRDEDFVGALGASYAPIGSENFNILPLIYRIKGYSYSFPMVYPSYEPYAQLNALKALPIYKLYGFVMSLLSSIPTDGQMYNIKDGAFQFRDGEISVEDWIGEMDPARLNTLQLKGIYRFGDRENDSASAIINNMLIGLPFGFYDLRNYAAIYTLNNQSYVHTYMLARFPRGWKIYDLHSAYLSFPVYGNAITLDEYEEGSYPALNSEDFVATWLDGGTLNENALHEATFDADSLVGTWSGMGMTLVLSTNNVRSATFSLKEESTKGWWNASDQYLLYFGEDGSKEFFIYTLYGDALMLHSTEDTIVKLSKQAS